MAARMSVIIISCAARFMAFMFATFNTRADMEEYITKHNLTITHFRVQFLDEKILEYEYKLRFEDLEEKEIEWIEAQIDKLNKKKECINEGGEAC